MRYTKQPIIIFETRDGKRLPMRDVREIPENPTAFVITDLPAGSMADEIASRPEGYGDSHEYLAYAVVEKNAVEFIEGGFSLDGVRDLLFPAVADVLQ